MKNLLIYLMLPLLFVIGNSGFVQGQNLGGLIKNESQQKDPVSWKSEIKKISGDEFELIFKATPDAKWHFYSQYTEGTMPMAFYFDDIKGYKTVGEVSESPKPKEEYDEVLGGLTKYWDATATFKQKIKITDKGKIKVHGAVEYQACINGACMPLTYNFSHTVEGISSSVETENTTSPTTTETPIVEQSATQTLDSAENQTVTQENTTSPVELNEDEYKKLIWEPVIEELKNYENANDIANKGMWMIFILGFVGGLIALMTPCVWPMIPMTVSFFIKKDASKGKRDAVIYGLSIVGIYMILGMGVTGIFG
ncbi:MAG: hypothetical protein JXR34_10895, partial [Bacteroidales bacterium]|nr:hypothetical protein [Bacteroidales bacterium]